MDESDLPGGSGPGRGPGTTKGGSEAKSTGVRALVACCETAQGEDGRHALRTHPTHPNYLCFFDEGEGAAPSDGCRFKHESRRKRYRGAGSSWRPAVGLEDAIEVPGAGLGSIPEEGVDESVPPSRRLGLLRWESRRASERGLAQGMVACTSS